jgi:hypothetical protein
MRRGHHTSSVIKALGVSTEEPAEAIGEIPEEKVPTEIE